MLSNDLDFLGISEHNHYTSLRNPGFKRSRYQVSLNMANSANLDGSFVAMFGMEYGISSTHNGHVVIYGFNQLLGWETNVGGQSGNNYDIYNAKGDYDGLFKKVKNNPNAFCYLAHPYWTDFTLDGTDNTALANAPYNAAYDSAIVGVPLRSGDAFSMATDYSDYPVGNYFDYFKKLLNIGYHIGIGYDHDNHYTNFGRSNGGRLVILAPSLTRANIYDAMQQMRFYGSDDSNAKVEFTMNGNVMGSVLTGSIYPTVNVVHNDPDGETADTIRIWKGYKNSGGAWANVIYTGLNTNIATFYDENLISGIEYYYFAELRQHDGQWIVTSPIWYKGSTPVFVEKLERKLTFACYPNPVSGNLSLIAEEADLYEVNLYDASGRSVLQTQFSGTYSNLSLTAIKPGFYQLFIRSSKGIYSQKISLE
jgi:hypothetical protein